MTYTYTSLVANELRVLSVTKSKYVTKYGKTTTITTNYLLL